jgi:hypothetical protein
MDVCGAFNVFDFALDANLTTIFLPGQADPVPIGFNTPSKTFRMDFDWKYQTVSGYTRNSNAIAWPPRPVFEAGLYQMASQGILFIGFEVSRTNLWDLDFSRIPSVSVGQLDLVGTVVEPIDLSAGSTVEMSLFGLCLIVLLLN